MHSITVRTGMIAKTRQLGGARGVLRSAPATGDFHHARIAPGATLADHVQHFWIVTWDLGDGPPQQRETLPHPNLHLVLETDGKAALHGIHGGRFTTLLERRGGVFGVKFRPGGLRSFLGAPLSTLRDRSVPATTVFGPRAGALCAEVWACRDDAARVEVVAAFLAPRLPPVDAQGLLAAEIVDTIAVDRDLTTVERVAARWHLGTRTLQRLFSDEVGVGPKWVINRFRLHEALEQVQRGHDVRWSDLAQELGYFDQAHFIRDFKALVGRTPADYANG
jgi:AraC-like DNA-binding protein